MNVSFSSNTPGPTASLERPAHQNSESRTYDPTGNWHGSSTGYLTKASGSTTLNQNRAHNEANEITNITESAGTSWPTPSHDAAGNTDQIPRPLSLGNSFDLKYDAWNRLVEVKNTGGSVVATYAYDGANRRVTNDDGRYPPLLLQRPVAGARRAPQRRHQRRPLVRVGPALH